MFLTQLPHLSDSSTPKRLPGFPLFSQSFPNRPQKATLYQDESNKKERGMHALFCGRYDGSYLTFFKSLYTVSYSTWTIIYTRCINTQTAGNNILLLLWHAR